MNVNQIVEELRYIENHHFPQKALQAAIDNQEEVTPYLLEALQDLLEDPGTYANDEGYFLHNAALFLLAQFREERAYPLMLEICRLPEDTLYPLYGDSITEDFGPILASLCGGDPNGIQSLIEDDSVYEWVRSSGLSAILTLMNMGEMTREDAVAYFRHLYQTLNRTPANHILWGVLVLDSTYLHPGDLMDEIKQAYEDDLVDLFFIDWDDVKEEAAKPVDEILDQLADNRHHQPIDNAIEAMGWWAWFKPAPKTRSTPTTSTGTVVNEGPKVGRNDPCPCGSGMKYKYCCGKSG